MVVENIGDCELNKHNTNTNCFNASFRLYCLFPWFFFTINL